MKVVLVYLYGPRNAGDMALNLGAIDLMKRIYGIHLSGVSRFAKDHESYSQTTEYLNKVYGNLPVIPFPVSYDRNNTSRLSQLLAYLRGSLLYFPALGHSILGEDSVREAIEAADLVVFNGGNLLFSRNFKDNLRLRGILYPLLVAQKLSKPYIFLPQSIPSIENQAGRRKIMQVIDQSEFCMFRESNSAKKILHDNFENRVFLDLAFFIENTDLVRASILLKNNGLKEREFIPIILRATTLGDQGELSANEKSKTLELVKGVTKKAVSNGLKPALVVQTVKDLSFTKECKEEILKSLGVEVPIIEEYDPLVLRGIYEKAHMVVSLRLHAAIFSLSVGTKTIGIYRKIWGPKMPGIFGDLGLAEDCFELSQVIDNSDSFFKMLCSPNEREPSLCTYMFESISYHRERVLNAITDSV